MAKPKKQATCCPDKPAYGHGLCQTHYNDSRRERLREIWRAYDRRNRVKRRAKVRRWRAANSEKVAAMNARRKIRCAQAFHQFKEMVGCARCGYSKYGGALEFHHKDPKSKNKEKIFSAEGWFYKRPGVEEELAKCILLCKNCHAEEHAEMRKQKKKK